MDYEKKYNEALERAKYYHDRDNIQFLENIFPELKESEDERIRKSLIDMLKNDEKCYLKEIAWLEKQGEHSVSHLFTFEDVLTIQCAMAYAKFQDRELDVALKKLHDKVYDAYHDSKNHHIESQNGLKGEQILANSAKTCKDEQKPYGKREECYDCQMNYGGTCKGSCAMKRGEQKPADKIEPKFKQGEWIIFNGLILYVDEVVQGYYRTISIDGIPNSYDWDIDNAARLWTIQDVKDGDVLKEDSCTFIIQKLGDNGTAAKTYCTLYDDGDFDDGSILYFDADSTKPATKEQREQLEKAIADAGYVWLSGEKELKKIEQKPVPKFEVGDVMRTLQEAADNITSGLPVVVSIDDEYYRCNNELIAIKDQDDYEYPPMNRMQKSWGEEDNFMYNKIKNLLTDISLAPESINSLFDWLKDLRDRVQPQTTWKPSDEQMEALEKATHIVGSKYKSCLASLYQELNKLRKG